MSDIAIQVSHLSKQYRLGRIGGRRLVDDFSRWWAHVRRRPDPLTKIGARCRAANADAAIWALKDVSFEVKQGEVLGIIGRNGAGKSTLLKILSQVTAPTSGEARVKGRIASLLEVGTGFHPELTGRENIYLNGAILGMTKAEVRSKMNEIVGFSEVDQFIDTPVKRYSSGMYVRLAFAVAAHLEPPILVVDEVLAVGDVAFQKKCLGKIRDVTDRDGRTVLFVSHNLGAVSSLCHRALLLKDGRIVEEGPSNAVVRRYLSAVLPETTGRAFRIEERPGLVFQILSISVTRPNGDLLSQARLWDDVQIRLTYVVKRRLHGTNVAIWVSREGNTIFESFDTDLSSELFEERLPGHYLAIIPLPTGLLPVGTYTVSSSTGITSVGEIDAHRDAVSFEVVAGDEDIKHKSYSRQGIVMAKLGWRTEISTITRPD